MMTAAGRRLRAWPIAAALVVIAAVAMHPTLAQRWSIYASATGGAPETYPMFLGPFPTSQSCDVEAQIIVRSGGFAFCKSALTFEWGSAHQNELWNEFWPAPRWIALCAARLRGRPIRERSPVGKVVERRGLPRT